MKNSRVIAAAVLLAAGLSLAGCAASGGSSVGSSVGSSGGSSGSSPEIGAVAPQSAADGSAKSAGTASGSGSKTAADRSVVITGTVTITASNPVGAAGKAVALVEAAGGRIDGRTELAPANGDRGSATLVLRIPADKLTATLDDLEKLGRADRVDLTSSDVTAQSQDIDARVTALRTTIARLLQLESTATDTTNLIALETAIGDRQAQLEDLEAQQRGLADQVSMSTITLDLRSDAAAPPIKPADFWSGLATGWTAFSGFWAAVLVAVGVLIPWLVLLGAGTAVVLLVLRAVRRRAAARGAAGGAAGGAATPPAPIG